jgi:hypothetical protein
MFRINGPSGPEHGRRFPFVQPEAGRRYPFAEPEACPASRKLDSGVVEMRGLEPLTPAMRTRCSPS